MFSRCLWILWPTEVGFEGARKFGLQNNLRRAFRGRFSQAKRTKTSLPACAWVCFHALLGGKLFDCGFLFDHSLYSLRPRI